jgi:hypothetical protein
LRAREAYFGLKAGVSANIEEGGQTLFKTRQTGRYEYLPLIFCFHFTQTKEESAREKSCPPRYRQNRKIAQRRRRIMRPSASAPILPADAPPVG